MRLTRCGGRSKVGAEFDVQAGAELVVSVLQRRRPVRLPVPVELRLAQALVGHQLHRVARGRPFA
ncbi:MAG: hypothetical protein AAF368_05165, partial [Planctomycetota bacterium]